MKTKGQASESLIAIGAVYFVLVIFLPVITEAAAGIITSQDKLDKLHDCNILANAVNSVYNSNYEASVKIKLRHDAIISNSVNIDGVICHLHPNTTLFSVTLNAGDVLVSKKAGNVGVKNV